MTNILLSIIAVLLFARIVLQIRQGKRAVEKGYAAPSEVENKFCLVANTFELGEIIEEYNHNGFELVHLIYRKLNYSDKPDRYGWVLLFTQKKIKTYYD